MTAWEEYKKKRALELQNGAQVKPIDMFDKQNRTSDDIADKRMSICNDCDRLIPITHQCKECGCFMKMKVKLKTATCPLGKW
jgi:hypothetical protein